MSAPLRRSGPIEVVMLCPAWCTASHAPGRDVDDWHHRDILDDQAAGLYVGLTWCPGEPAFVALHTARDVSPADASRVAAGLTAATEMLAAPGEDSIVAFTRTPPTAEQTRAALARGVRTDFAISVPPSRPRGNDHDGILTMKWDEAGPRLTLLAWVTEDDRRRMLELAEQVALDTATRWEPWTPTDGDAWTVCLWLATTTS